MNWIKMFIICGSICGINGKNLTDDKLKQLIAEKIKEPNFDLTVLTDGKQDSTNLFFQWIQSLFSGSSTNEVMESNETKQCSECSCGKSNFRGRIVGGIRTNVNQYPWTGILLNRRLVLCGSSLINDRYVLTAAHCIEPYLDGMMTNRLLVRLLENDLSINTESKFVERRIKTFLIHPNYNNMTYENDIALVELEQPVEFVGVLNPVCLPTLGLNYEGENGIITGYGKTRDGTYPNVEQQGPVLIQSYDNCTSRLDIKFTDNMICTGSYLNYMTSFCDGDDGGGLNFLNKTTDSYQVVGIASLSFNCSADGRPNVYTRVTNYDTWINENTMNACKCS